MIDRKSMLVPGAALRFSRIAVSLLVLCACTPEMELSYAGPVSSWPESHGFDEWPYYSPLDQIRIWNARHLALDWEARVPLAPGAASLSMRAGTLWVCVDAAHQLLDADTGRLLPANGHNEDACPVGSPGELRLHVQSPFESTDYRAVRLAPTDPERLFGLPAAAPPWTVLEAVDRDTGMPRWSVALGTTRNLLPFPFWFKFGAEVKTPPILTATGIIFIATQDRFLRAFHAHDGHEVWAKQLPGEPVAGPITYRVSSHSKQRVVVLVASGDDELIAVSFSAPGDSGQPS